MIEVRRGEGAERFASVVVRFEGDSFEVPDGATVTVASGACNVETGSGREISLPLSRVEILYDRPGLGETHRTILR